VYNLIITYQKNNDTINSLNRTSENIKIEALKNIIVKELFVKQKRNIIS